MSESEISKEERVLVAVRSVLIDVIKDTTTKPGMRHPLTEHTIDGLRNALDLISARQAELADEAGRPMTMRPHFIDEPKKERDSVVVSLDSLKKKPES